MIDAGYGRDVLVHAGPGAGKTLGALLGFQTMNKERRLTSFIVFCHRNSILDQWRKSAQLLGLTVEDLENWPENKPLPQNVDGLILTYQGSSKRAKELSYLIGDWASKGLLSIADEAHHLGVDPDEPQGAVWGRTFLELTDLSKLRLGLTGTPFRADNLAFCSARKVLVQEEGKLVEKITPDLCIEPRELISAGDVRPLEFHFQDGWVEHARKGQADRDVSSLSAEWRESWRARNLRQAISLSGSSSIALQLLVRARKKLEKIRLEHENAAGLVISRDIQHAKGIANLLKEDGDSVELVHSKDVGASERLARFQTSKANWLVSVDMCSEGFDAPRLRAVAYLTNVVTKSRFIQGITRAVRMSSARARLEPVPRYPSYVFAPADPLLMEYARSWSISKPYLIKGNHSVTSIGSGTWISSQPVLPLEAVNDKAGKIIRMRPIELPNFLKG